MTKSTTQLTISMEFLSDVLQKNPKKQNKNHFPYTDNNVDL